MLRALGPALVVVLALGATRGASAEPKKTNADALFDEGKTFLQQGHWPAACAKFQASFEADPAVSTAVKIARCREHEGKLVLALSEYRRALELNRTLPQNPERTKELDALIRTDLAALEPRIPKVHIEITPRASGLEVWVNGERVPDESLDVSFPVDPGDAEVVVRAPGYRQERLKPRVPEGVTHEIVLRLVQEASAVAPSPSPTQTAPAGAPLAPVTPPAGGSAPRQAIDAPEGAPGSGQRTVGLVVGGAGVVALGVAAFFGVQTIMLVSAATPRCPKGECDAEGYRMINDAGTAQTIGLIAGGIGAALTGTGIALYLTAPSTGARPETAFALRLGAGSAKLEGAF